jgi:hypothetical protein
VRQQAGLEAQQGLLSGGLWSNRKRMAALSLSLLTREVKRLSGCI